jgi:preprotein translocase subunit YajC
MNLNSLTVILADTATGQTMQVPNQKGQIFGAIGPILLMLVMLYFVMIRPQTKKAKEHAAMLKSMKMGDRVVTSGGVVGTIITVKEKTVSIRSAETKLEVLKSAVSEISERSSEASSSES